MKLVIILIFAVCSAFAADKTVFAENFTKPDALKSWRKVLKENGAKFVIAPDGLHVEHKHLRSGGGFIEIPVPLIKKADWILMLKSSSREAVLPVSG